MGAINYLLQVSGSLAIFCLFYYLLPGRLTFFTLNRFYLLGMLISSFIIPLLIIPLHLPDHYTPIMQPATFIRSLEKSALVERHAQPEAQGINWVQMLIGVYIIVTAALFARMIIALLGLFINLKRRKINRIGRISILHGNKKLSNGSFLHYIFLNEEKLSDDEIRQVIAHEMLHIKLFHSADRILMKICRIVLWFNPVVYLYARAMEENHEFEVDHAMGGSVDKKEYAALLLHLCAASPAMLYNSFSRLPLKRRIDMLFKQPSAKSGKLIYVLVAPVLAIGCLAFATLRPDMPPVPGAGPRTNAVEMQKEIKLLFAGGRFDDSKFFERAPLKGGVYDVVRIGVNGETHVTVLPHNLKVAFIINGQVHDESELAGLTQSQLQVSNRRQTPARAANPDLRGYGAFIGIGPGINPVSLTVKPNPASDALPRNIRGY